jgi:hypothetical protein
MCLYKWRKMQSFCFYGIPWGRFSGRVFLHDSDPCAQNRRTVFWFARLGINKAQVITLCKNIHEIHKIRLYITTCLFGNETSHCKLPNPLILEAWPPSFPFLTDLMDLAIAHIYTGLLHCSNRDDTSCSIGREIHIACKSICVPFILNQIHTLLTVCKPIISILAYEVLCLPFRGIIPNRKKAFCRTLPIDFGYRLFEKTCANIQPSQGNTLIHIFPWHRKGEMKILKGFTSYYPTLSL